MGASTPGAYLPSDTGNNYLRHGPGRACPPTRLTPCRFMNTPFVLVFLRNPSALPHIMHSFKARPGVFRAVSHRAGVRDPSNMRLGVVAQWHFCAAIEHGVSRLIVQWVAQSTSPSPVGLKNALNWPCCQIVLIYIYIYIYIYM